VPHRPITVGDSLGAQPLQRRVFVRAADVDASAEPGVGELVRCAVHDQLAIGQVRLVERLALEAIARRLR
jgi:hypothetical protein